MLKLTQQPSLLLRLKQMLMPNPRLTLTGGGEDTGGVRGLPMPRLDGEDTGARDLLMLTPALTGEDTGARGLRMPRLDGEDIGARDLLMLTPALTGEDTGARDLLMLRLALDGEDTGERGLLVARLALSADGAISTE